MARHVLCRDAMSSSSRSGFFSFAAAAGLLATTAGCLSVDSPAAYAGREKLRAEQVEATRGVMFGIAPQSFESSAGKIAIETLEFDQDHVFSTKFSRVMRLTVAGREPADLTCVHERVGSAYPPGFEFAESGAFACRGVVDSAGFMLAVDRGCYNGVLTLDGANRYTLRRGKVTLAGLEAPTDQVSLLDARGSLVAAFDLVPSMTFRVWSGEPQVKPSQAILIVAAAAIHDWSQYASSAKLDACN